MNAHITDEELLDVMNGRAADHVASHLVQCEDCWNEAHRMNASLARFASTMRFESARAEAATLRRPVRVRAITAGLRWAMAAAAVLVLAAIALLSYQRPSVGTAEDRYRAAASSQPTTAPSQAIPCVPVPPAEQERSDDALLMQVQDDMDRELPAALQPVTLIVAERNQSAEDLTQYSQGGNK